MPLFFHTHPTALEEAYPRPKFIFSWRNHYPFQLLHPCRGLRLQAYFQFFQPSGNGTWGNTLGFPLPRRSPNVAQMALCHLLLCTEIKIGLVFFFLPMFSLPVLAQVFPRSHGETPATCLDAVSEIQKPHSGGCREGNILHIDKQVRQATPREHLPWGLQKGQWYGQVGIHRTPFPFIYMKENPTMPKLPFHIYCIQFRLVTNPESQPGLTGCPVLHLRAPVPSVQ